MAKPFNPPQPEPDKILIKVVPRESHLIKILRGYRFGKFMITKMEGRLVRIEPNESKVLTDEGGLDLAVKGKS